MLLNWAEKRQSRLRNVRKMVVFTVRVLYKERECYAKLRVTSERMFLGKSELEKRG
jgi:hypothetical protein